MSRKVLIVDDSISTSRQLANMLSGFGGYRVVGRAKNGAEAVQLFRALKPDLVLLDLVMPMMDGIKSLRTLMKLDSQAKVVIISSMGGVGQKVAEAIRLGARSVISKPFEPDQVHSILEKAFEQE